MIWSLREQDWTYSFVGDRIYGMMWRNLPPESPPYSIQNEAGDLTGAMSYRLPPKPDNQNNYHYSFVLVIIIKTCGTKVTTESANICQ